METKMREKLKKDAHSLRPAVQVGKNGLTESSMAEIKKQLKKSKLIKVKLLKNSSIQKEDLVDLFESQLNATVISIVGTVCTLYKR